jgi:GNAT superfamily N-acetyltransferase
MKNLNYILRKYVQSDEGFIYNSFLRSYKRSEQFIEDQLYYKNQGDIIKFLIENYTTYVAVFQEAPEEIIGYVIFNYSGAATIFHYIYLRKIYWKQGIGSSIFNSINKGLSVCTHKNESFGYLKKKFNLIYDPYLITNLRLRA